MVTTVFCLQAASRGKCRHDGVLFIYMYHLLNDDWMSELPSNWLFGLQEMTVSEGLCSVTRRQDGVAYTRLPCGECDTVHIGETGRPVQKNIKEHERVVCQACQNSVVPENANMIQTTQPDMAPVGIKSSALIHTGMLAESRE